MICIVHYIKRHLLFGDAAKFIDFSHNHSSLIISDVLKKKNLIYTLLIFSHSYK